MILSSYSIIKSNRNELVLFSSSNRNVALAQGYAQIECITNHIFEFVHKEYVYLTRLRLASLCIQLNLTHGDLQRVFDFYLGELTVVTNWI